MECRIGAFVAAGLSGLLEAWAGTKVPLQSECSVAVCFIFFCRVLFYFCTVTHCCLVCHSEAEPLPNDRLCVVILCNQQPRNCLTTIVCLSACCMWRQSFFRSHLQCHTGLWLYRESTINPGPQHSIPRFIPPFSNLIKYITWQKVTNRPPQFLSYLKTLNTNVEQDII